MHLLLLQYAFAGLCSYYVTFWVVCGLLYLFIDEAPTSPRQTIRVVLTNQFLVTPIFVSGLLGVGQSLYEVPTREFSWSDTVGRLALTALVVDLLFLILHRSYHRPALYHLHKLHHQKTVDVTPMDSNYCHWTEMVFVNLLAVIPPILLFRLSTFQLCLWFSIVAFDTTKSHSSGLFRIHPRLAPHVIHHTKQTNPYGSSLGLFETALAPL